MMMMMMIIVIIIIIIIISIAFKGRDPVRTKIVIGNKNIEQVNLFNCLGNMISYEGELDK